MKKKALFLLTFMLSAFGFVVGVNASNELPGEVSGKITLTDDVTLQTAFVVNDDKTLEIDLAGHKITGPESGYAINNKGTLTITDSTISDIVSLEEENFICSASSSSCIRNAKSLTIKNVLINSKNFIAVKNEEKSTLNVENAIVNSGVVAIENYGTATIKDSYITSDSENGTAIYEFTYEDNDSSIELDNVGIAAVNAIKTAQVSTDGQKSAKTSIKIKGGEIVSIDPVISKYTNGIDGHQVSDPQESTVEVTGNITAPSSIVQYAKSGTKVTVNLISDSFTIPEGVEVYADEGMQLVSDGNGNYSVIEKTEDETTTTVAAATTQAPSNNPNTSDNASLFFILAIIGLGAALFTTKSLVKHN